MEGDLPREYVGQSRRICWVIFSTLPVALEKVSDAAPAEVVPGTPVLRDRLRAEREHSGAEVCSYFSALKFSSVSRGTLGC